MLTCLTTLGIDVLGIAVLTFSNFNLTGLGITEVIFSAISLPILKASSLEAPFSKMNMLSVSPYTTLPPHSLVELTMLIAC